MGESNESGNSLCQFFVSAARFSRDQFDSARDHSETERGWKEARKMNRGPPAARASALARANVKAAQMEARVAAERSRHNPSSQFSQVASSRNSSTGAG